MSSFNGVDLFGSGPHRFGRRGLGQLLSRGDPAFPLPRLVPLGLRDESVLVRGRLVAADEAQLRTLRSAITGLLTEFPTRGELIDDNGNSWADLSFIRFEEGERTDRGRTVSLRYEAEFLGLL